MSLRAYLARLIWICVLPPALLAAYLAYDHVETLRSNRRAEATVLVENVATAIDRDLSARIAGLQILAASPDVDRPGADLADLYQHAAGYRDHLGGDVVLADRRLNMVFSTRVPFGTLLPALTLSKGRAAAPEALRTGKPAIGDVFLRPMSNEPQVSIAVPVVRAGATNFLLLAVFETRTFQQQIERVALPPGWGLTLTDGTGTVLAHRAPSTAVSGDADSAAPRRFVATSTVSPWRLALEIPLEFYDAPRRVAALELTLAFLAATLAAVLGGLLAGRRLATAVGALVHAPAGPSTSGRDIAEIAHVRRLLDDAARERESAESAQRASERRFRATFEQAAVGMAMVAPDGRLMLANRALCEIVGYSPEELQAKTVVDITHPDDFVAENASRQRMLAGEAESCSGESRYLRKDGETIWARVTTALARHRDGTPDYFISIVEDIQRRKEIESSLVASEAALREAQRLAGLGHWSWNLRTGVHKWSEEIYRIYGRHPGLAPVGYPDVREYFTPESWERLATAVEDGVLQGRGYECDAEVVRPDGSHRWVTLRGEAVCDFLGEVREVHGTVQDITERRGVLEQLEESRQRLEGLVASAMDAIITVDASQKITLFNPAAERMFGVRAGDMMGQSLDSLIPAPARQAHTRQVARFGDTGATKRAHGGLGKVQGLRANGETFPAEVAISRVMVGTRQYFTAVLRDITARVEAEETVRQLNLDLERRVAERTAELEDANRELAAFDYSVSHDLRAPLNRIRGFSEALSREFGTRFPEGAGELLSRLTAAADSMDSLVTDMLSLSTIARGDVQRTDVDLSALACNILDSFERADPARRVERLVASTLRASADPGLMRIVLENLLGNAWKFTSRRADARIEFGSDTMGPVRCYFVRDNGVGFDPALAGKLFEPFRRLHSQAEFRGTGIGLATVQRVIRRHGGRIWAESAVGQGATFFFTLPPA